MTIREELERLEHTQLDKKAAFSDESRGRLRPEDPKTGMYARFISGIRTRSFTVRPSAG